jgi:hypothetical protein
LYLPVIPALRRPKQEDHKREASLGYMARHLSQKKKKKAHKKQRHGDILA